MTSMLPSNNSIYSTCPDFMFSNRFRCNHTTIIGHYFHQSLLIYIREPGWLIILRSMDVSALDSKSKRSFKEQRTLGYKSNMCLQFHKPEPYFMGLWISYWCGFWEEMQTGTISTAEPYDKPR